MTGQSERQSREASFLVSDQLYPLLALQPWANCLKSLSLSVLYTVVAYHPSLF